MESLLKTGIVWHEDMLLHAPPEWPEKDHCENPDRLRAVIKVLSECPSSKEPDVEIITEYEEAGPDFVNAGHNSTTYYDMIKNLYDPAKPGSRCVDKYYESVRPLTLKTKDPNLLQ
jgi:hypothetical protein